MSGWNFNMDEAPKGKTVTVERLIGKNLVMVEMHKPTNIIAAMRGTTGVTVSYWIPKAERWCMFTKDAPPLAWHLFPEHPEAGA